MGPVIHQFSTHGIAESEGIELLRRQVAKESLPDDVPAGMSVVEYATTKLMAMTEAFGRLTPEQQERVTTRPFTELTAPEERAALVAYAEAIGGVLDASTGQIDMVGLTPRATRSQRFLAVENIASGGHVR